MKRNRTTNEFIEICNKIHNNKYDYSKTVYTKKDNKIIIICPIHGEFEQIANSHIRGNECKKCAHTGKKMSNISEFIKKSNIRHNNKYDYSKSIYISNKSKIKIICPIHGEFEQNANNHLNGNGCKKCGKYTQAEKTKISLNDFKLISNEIHNNKYDYSLVDYKNANTKINIICPTHGIFEQKPSSHIHQKQGCPICHYENVKNNAPSWTKENWVLSANKSKKFDSFKLYIIKCYNDNESFYKVGRTYNKLYKRFTQIPYNVEIIRIIESEDGGYIFDLEKRLKQKYKRLKYLPKINFGGKHECFNY
jgi:hypothetical protein